MTYVVFDEDGVIHNETDELSQVDQAAMEFSRELYHQILDFSDEYPKDFLVEQIIESVLATLMESANLPDAWLHERATRIAKVRAMLRKQPDWNTYESVVLQ